jgi:hypothetical protein
MSEENRVEEHEPTYETAAEPEMPSKFQTEPEPEPGYEMGYLVENVPGDEEVGKLEPLTGACCGRSTSPWRRSVRGRTRRRRRWATKSRGGPRTIGTAWALTMSYGGTG